MKEIPFLKAFHDLIRCHFKTMTCRTSRYGRAGDRLRVNGTDIEIELVGVFRLLLRRVSQDYYQEEGCQTPAEFRTIWKRLHRGRYNGDRVVWVHRFVKVKP